MNVKKYPKMPRKKKSEDMVQSSLGHRISKHEAICAERMKTLFKAIDEMRTDIKNLKKDINKGKGAINVLIFLAGFIGAMIGFFKWNG